MNDMFGMPIIAGDVVLKPKMLGRSPFIEKRTVTLIKDGKIYLDDSKVAINFPERLVVYNV